MHVVLENAMHDVYILKGIIRQGKLVCTIADHPDYFMLWWCRQKQSEKLKWIDPEKLKCRHEQSKQSESIQNSN